MDQFIAQETLDQLSYHSSLEQNLKSISLRQTPLEAILDDIAKYRSSYIDILVQNNLIGSRFKSEDSILRKYQKTLMTGGGFKQCFNDVLGFRLRFAAYPDKYPSYFRVVNLREGKHIDDGYRAVHLYYQRDNRSYPIEIQLWCGKDHFFNLWSHKYIYKSRSPELGKALYQLFSNGTIQTEQDFLFQLGKLGGNQNGDSKNLCDRKSL